jgi:hypothetical protein
VDVDGRKDIDGGGNVHMPVSEVVDDTRGGRRFERLAGESGAFVIPAGAGLMAASPTEASLSRVG